MTLRRPFRDQRIVLGVTGGIASYKSVWLARLLTQYGAEVDVVMTSSAREFVGVVTFEAVTGRKVYTDIFGAGNALDHIHLAREARAILVAPATADFLARAAHGHADDLLSAVLLASTCPVMLAPAMNDRMWTHGQTQRNVAHVREIGYHVLDPDTGPLAVGEGNGPGRLPEPEAILAHFARLVESNQSLRGTQVVVTAGATREAIDPVRFISNHSSGKMGFALATAAWERGADVTVITGHVDVPHPIGPTTVSVETTADMQKAVAELLPTTDVLIMAAAPADFTPMQQVPQKIKKTGQPLTLELTEAPDILKSTISARRPDTLVVGFALETQTVTEFARKKLSDKQLDMIVANQAGEDDAGFGVDTNRVTIIDRRNSVIELPLMSKRDVADHVLDQVEGLLNGR